MHVFRPNSNPGLSVAPALTTGPLCHEDQLERLRMTLMRSSSNTGGDFRPGKKKFSLSTGLRSCIDVLKAKRPDEAERGHREGHDCRAAGRDWQASNEQENSSAAAAASLCKRVYFERRTLPPWRQRGLSARSERHTEVIGGHSLCFNCHLKRASVGFATHKKISHNPALHKVSRLV